MASRFIPDLVDPTLTEEQTFAVLLSAFGILLINLISPFVNPLSTKAEKPPMKSIPISVAALSSAFANIV